MSDESKKEAQEAYLDTKKGKEAMEKAREKYDRENPEKRKVQKRDYMRRKRDEDPNYGRS